MYSTFYYPYFSYRLAPEHLYPAAIDDCMLAVKHFLSNARDLGVDPDRVCVAGESGSLMSRGAVAHGTCPLYSVELESNQRA